MSFGLASLSDQQNLLLAQIACAQVDAPSRGLSAYRANAQANARRALEVTYPIIAQMVGEENFAYLARDFLHHFPPQRGDLAQWGGQLASFLAEAPLLAPV